MTKIGLITDTHYGVRNDNVVFYDYFRKSNDYFFKVMKEHNIESIIHLGDYYHNRKGVNLLTAFFGNTELGKRLAVYDTHIILGNHDCFYNNTNSVNSPDLTLSDLNIPIYRNPTEIEIERIPILLLPWINDENRVHSMSLIAETKAQICFGHLELQGFVMDQGRISDHGLSPSIFDKFDFVGSGHFHTKSTKDNIHYLGAHCEHSWADYGDPRGFHIFDLKTRELTYFKNPINMFNMIAFDNWNSETINDFDYTKYYEKFVRILVVNKPDQYLFDMFLDKMYNASPANVSTIESEAFAENGIINPVIEGAMVVNDTPTLLNDYIDELQTKLDPIRIKQEMNTIYEEAKMMEKI